MIKGAIVGLGGMGLKHLPIFESMNDVELVAIVTSQLEKSREKVKNKALKLYSTIDELLEHEHIDFIDLCTPTFLHKEQAIKAMKKGIHVLCEKPMALSSLEALEMADCANRHHVYLMVAHVLRFWPEYLYLKKTFENQTLGKLYHAHFSRIGEKPAWSAGNWMLDGQKSGRVVLDLHIHDVDFILYLLGSPKHVTHFNSEDGERISYVLSSFEYEDYFVSAEAAWYNCPYPFSMSYRAVFEQGILEYKDRKLVLYEQGKEAQFISVSFENAFQNELNYFISCIRQKQAPCVITPEESVECLKILEKIKK